MMTLTFEYVDLDDSDRIKRFEQMFESFDGIEKCHVGLIINEPDRVI